VSTVFISNQHSKVVVAPLTWDQQQRLQPDGLRCCNYVISKQAQQQQQQDVTLA